MKFFKLAVAFAMTLMAMPMSAQFANSGNSGNSGSSSDAPASYNRFTVGYDALFFSGKYSGFIMDDEEGLAMGDVGTTLSGFNLQYIHGFRLLESHPVYLETGAKLSANFSKKSFTEEDYWKLTLTTTSMSMSVPLNVAYRFAINDDISVLPYTGINLKFNLIGKLNGKSTDSAHEEDFDEDLNFFDKEDFDKDFRWKRFQFGWQAGVGLNIKKLYVGLEYGLDFNALYKKCNTSHLSVNLGINF